MLSPARFFTTPATQPPPDTTCHVPPEPPVSSVVPSKQVQHHHTISYQPRPQPHTAHALRHTQPVCASPVWFAPLVWGSLPPPSFVGSPSVVWGALCVGRSLVLYINLLLWVPPLLCPVFLQCFGLTPHQRAEAEVAHVVGGGWGCSAVDGLPLPQALPPPVEPVRPRSRSPICAGLYIHNIY